MMTPVAQHAFRVREITTTKRCGIKGSEAAALLQGLGVSVPLTANSNVTFSGANTGRCLRLGLNEFLLEQDDGTALLDAVSAALQQQSGRHAYAQRCDTSLLLYGKGLYVALREICAYDFESPEARADEAVMTLMAGISVTFIREAQGSEPGLRLWCDPTLGVYLHECLLALGASPSELSSTSVNYHQAVSHEQTTST